MFRTIKWYFKFVAALIAETPKLSKAKKILDEKGQKEYDNYVYNVTTKWAQGRIKDSGAKITVHNQERIPNDRNVLFVSNHQSDFDIAIFMALIEKNAGFVAKIELKKAPLLRSWMENIHCVFMDRNDMKQSLQTILDGIHNLKNGYSMVVFPEGTRSKCSNMGDFKAGSFKLATKSKVPIVPVTMDGSYKIMESNHYKIKPAVVDVYIHEPIYIDKLSKEELSAVPERVKNIIENGIVHK